MSSLSIADIRETAAPVAYPPAPAGQVLYVIGDIHGRRDLLDKVFEAIDDDKARARDHDQDPAWGKGHAGFVPAPPENESTLAAEAESPRPYSFIGPDLTVNGLIQARGDVRIDGHVYGDVRADGIMLGEGASIEGSMFARDVVIDGCMKGSVRGDRVILGSVSHIQADVLHKSLIIEQGCQFEGRSRRLDHRHGAGGHDGLLPSSPVLEIYLGDYIDRGDDSRGVVDALIERAEQVDAVFLRGNHEQFLLDFLGGTLDLPSWKQVGALATLRSYGVYMGQPPFVASQAALREALGEALPERHARFFADTMLYFVVGPYVFVHAGLRPGIPLEQQQSADLMGIRQQFLKFEGDLGHIVVHGHTPVSHPEFKPNRINLDTGAYSTGRLTCLRIDRNGPELLMA